MNKEQTQQDGVVDEAQVVQSEGGNPGEGGNVGTNGEETPAAQGQSLPETKGVEPVADPTQIPAEDQETPDPAEDAEPINPIVMTEEEKALVKRYDLKLDEVEREDVEALGCFEKRFKAICDSFAFRMKDLPRAKSVAEQMLMPMMEAVIPMILNGEPPKDNTPSTEEQEDSVSNARVQFDSKDGTARSRPVVL